MSHTPAQNARRRERYARDPEYRAACLARAKVRAAKNPEAERARTAAWRAANPEKKRINARKRQGMIDPPGDAKVGPCETCTFVGPLVCDHDHATGRVRGWLCLSCNCALGSAKDSIETLENLKRYLETHVLHSGR